MQLHVCFHYDSVIYMIYTLLYCFAPWNDHYTTISMLPEWHMYTYVKVIQRHYSVHGHTCGTLSKAVIIRAILARYIIILPSFNCVPEWFHSILNYGEHNPSLLS